jgi:ubiquitin carboxyl-terminal hydrolase 7
VLNLQLKRFEYDFMRDMQVKIHDRFEFSEQMDLARYINSPSPVVYNLFAVLVHGGDVHGGHYVAYINPKATPGSQWFKFDDDRVTKCAAKDAIEGNFGNDPVSTGTRAYRRFSSAYLLVYVRADDVSNVLADVALDTIPVHVREFFAQEKQEQERKLKLAEEERLHVRFRLVTPNDLVGLAVPEYGLPSYAIESDYTFGRVFRVPKTSPPRDVLTAAAEVLKAPVDSFSMWSFATTQRNGTRPVRRIDAKYLSKLQSAHDFCETSQRHVAFLAVPNSTPEDITLTIKLFDPESEELKIAGVLALSPRSRLVDVEPALRAMCGLPVDQPLRMSEEQPQKIVAAIDTRQTLDALELNPGDIVIVQPELPEGMLEKCRFQSPSELLKWMAERIVVDVRDSSAPDESIKTIELRDSLAYTDWTAIVAKELGIEDPSYLRFFYETSTGLVSIYHRTNPPLSYTFYNKKSVKKLFFERLGMPLSEYENRCRVKVTFLDEHVHEKETLEVVVPLQSTVEAVLKVVREHFQISAEERLRVMNLQYNYGRVRERLPQDILQADSHLRVEVCWCYLFLLLFSFSVSACFDPSVCFCISRSRSLSLSLDLCAWLECSQWRSACTPRSSRSKTAIKLSK